MFDINSDCTSNRGHGSAVSLPRLIVGKRHCRVLTLGNIGSRRKARSAHPT